MPKRNVILLVVVCLSCLAAYAAREQAAAGRRFGEVLSLVRSSYYESVDDERLFDAAVDAALGELDENSAYIRGGDRSDLEATLDQNFGGVGLELVIDERRRLPVVASPVIDLPAWRAGVRAGDWIEAVDGESTVGRPLREVVGRLRGGVGETVSMHVATALPTPVATLDPTAPGPEPIARRDVTLVRERIETESVVGDRRDPAGRWDWMLEGAPGVGYVRITSFGERTAGELAKALAAIEATGDIRGLVIDLRGNPGGLMTAAVEACDLLLEEGVIVHTRKHRSNAAGATPVDSRRAAAGASLRDVAVVVLVDGLTASAAEIVAACLQDAGRATVVGSRTFGKGTVQSILPLSDDRGLLKLTTSEYLRPSQATIHRREGDGDDDVWGVSPDTGYEVAPTAETVARVAAWRRARDAAGPVPTWMTVSGLPRDIDRVLARGLDAISARADLSGKEETASDQHESAAAGD
ncbi:MAG: S41 family peptidase [Planctomycetaceae bacterium]